MPSRQTEAERAANERIRQQIAESPPPRLGVLDRDVYTVEEFAVVMGVELNTVRQWIRRGDLAAFDLGGRSGQRIRTEAIRAFWERLERERGAARQVAEE